MKSVIIALIGLFALLQYQLWFSDGGVLSIHRLTDQISLQQQSNAKMHERNKTLAAEVIDLKRGNQAVAERAREDLGMIKKGETFYQVVPANTDSSNS